MPASLTLGTGLLSGRTGPALARRIVDAALQAGVRRVDTARAYGDGETEHVLGAALRRRPDVEIVTKVGLGPLDRRVRSAVVWRAAAPLLGRLPARAASTAAPGDEELDPQAGARFDERSVRASLDRSRRALRRDRLDLVLLHELDVDDDVRRVADLMDGLVAEGVIAGWGVGTRRAALRRLRDTAAPVGGFVQTTGGPLLPPPPVSAGVALGVHSVLGPGGGLLRAFLEWLPSSGLQDVWEHAVGPVDARRTAGAQLIRLAVASPEIATVLVSSRDPEGLARTVVATRDGETLERVALLTPVVEAFRSRDDG